ncbi:MAG: FAD-dependent oxidoreductase, partial [Candidatus Omnitrophica bacterium]|nr:FAD-dependent oxidoreductase [Candidatus Omnitrophota bacterium]
RNIAARFLKYDLEKIVLRQRCPFIKEEVVSLDPGKKEVRTKTRSINYDYIVLAPGSETNFYNNANLRSNAYKLDDVGDALGISGDLAVNRYESYLVGGGGYTGVEVATNLRVFLNKNKLAGKIIIVERAPAILGPLPDWMKEYVLHNLKALEVDVLLNTSIEKIEGDKVYLAGGKVFPRSKVIWAAGVKTPDFIQNLKVEKNPQGRIKVDKYLRLNESCFVAGDAAFFQQGNTYLRMAVQFAITQGECAGLNVLRSIKGRGLAAYRLLDLGYIIPMANNRSCGRVLGVNLKGLLPTVFHFIMCLYRSYGLRNRFGVLKGLLKKE